jgi:PAS domain S-box-containing protein
LRTIRVLHVDDEKSFLEVASHFMQKVGGLEVHGVTSVRSAMEMISKAKFDVIVSDYQMPEADGIEFLKMVRARGSDIPFILFTGKGREDVVIEALNLGADYYLQKGGDLRSQFHELASMITQAAQGKRASVELEESQERFRRLADSISDSLVGLDDDFRITFWNRAATEVIGTKPEDAIGRNALDVVPQVLGTELEQKLREAASSRTKRTHTFDVELRGEARSFDIGIYPGEEGLLVFARDVTASKAVAQRLTESEERYRALVESSPDAIIVFAIDRILYANPAAVTLYGGGESISLVGMRIFDLMPPEFVSESAERIRQMYEEGRMTTPRIMKILTKRGETLEMEVRSTPVTFLGKKAIQSIARDVTERNLTEKLLQAHQQELQRILDSVPAMISYQDKEGRFVRVNAPFADKTGIDEMSWSGRTVEEVLPGLGEIFSSRNREIIDAGKSVTGLLIPYQARQGVRWARTDKIPYVNDAGEVIGVITVAEDITDKLDSERKLARQRVMLDCIQDAVMFLDPGFVIQSWNAAAERLYGFRGEEAIGRDARELLGEEHTDNDPADLRTRLDKDGHIEFVFRQRRKDGAWIPVNSTMVALRDSDGMITGYGVINKDISERAELEESLRRSEERFQKAFKSSPVATFMTRLRDGVVIDANEVALGLLGYSLDEILGKTTLEIGVVDESQREKIRRRLSTGVPIRNERYTYRSRSGEERLADYSAEVIDIAGEKVMVIVANDVTEKEQALAALKESEEKFKVIAETSRDCIFRFTLSPEAKAEYVSPAVEAITGYSPEEFYTDPGLITKITMSDEGPGSLDEPGRLERYSTPVARRCVRKDGKIVWIEATATPVLKDGHVVAVQGVARDVTERKSYEDALNKVNKKLNLLGSVTRHDSLNLIGVLMGWLEAAIEKEKDDSVRDMLLKVKKASDSLKTHLEFTSQYRDLGMKSPNWMSLVETVSKVTEGLDRQGISVGVDIEGIELYADPMLESVFRNLVNNSIVHGGDVTMISVSHRSDGKDGLVLVYEDDGVGIPFEDKERVFERGHGRRHGYGLYLGREVLSITGMTIKETGKPGEGARFEISVPPDGHRKQGA